MSLPFTVEFKRPQENQIADCLSRLYATEDDLLQDEGKTSINSVNIIKSDLTQEVVKEPLNVLPKEKSKNVPNLNSKQNRHVINLVKNIPLAFTSIEKHQSNDPECFEIIQSVRNKTNSQCYYLKDRVLLYKKSYRSQIYLPENLINLVFAYYHSSVNGGHPGYNRKLGKITEYL